ncbi:hypothetical protein C0033_08905 [Clostridium sp. chh4-2]|uniref:phage minor head protein n=1 Tax=Clostridium sp. chh4-2 TaxID=2067550 RepID=UPI000CCEA3DD|nr:phage minor head protein [Clostridium sp. chh4-2]PNV62222.1 hypothetical protein C0033_08905 [Clostridium sp. chh4-2]
MADYEYDDLNRLLVQVRRIEEHREKGAEAEIRKAYQELMKELQHYLADTYTQYAEDDQLTYAILQKHGYYARFLEEVEQKINDISPDVKRLIRSMVDQTYEYTYNGMIDCVKKASAGVEMGTLKACTPDIIRRAVENPVSKLTLNDRLEKHRKEIIYDIKQNISVGLMNGDRYSTMANRIKKSVNGDYKKAIRIARTETHRVREAGNHDAALLTDEVLKISESGMWMAKTWKTMKDERVRPAGKTKGKARRYDHRKMEGIMIPVEEEFTLPSGAKTMAPGQSGVAGEDINCRCYLSYGLKKADLQDKEPQGRKKRTKEELQAASVNAKNITEKYTTRPSKWSGKVTVDDEACRRDKIAGRKEWNCDILLKSTASDKTIIHEHLHARSGSYLNRITYIKHGAMEEASVELLAREICTNERIPFSGYPRHGVEALRKINRITGLRDNDLDFAVSLFGKSLDRRYSWLEAQVDRYLKMNNQDSEALRELLRQVKGANW